MPENFHVPPKTAYLEILYGCNLRCSYCYVGDDRNHRHPIIPTSDEISQLLFILRSQGIEEVILLGGEPSLHPELPQICNAMRTLDFSSRGMVSNGSGISLESAKHIVGSGLWVNITCRGAIQDTFDALAGKAGAWVTAFRALEILNAAGAQLGVEYDCTPQNANQILDLGRLLVERNLSIRQIRLHRIVETGNATRERAEFRLTPDQWRYVLDQAAQIRTEFGIPVIFEDGLPFCITDKKHWDLLVPCGCGHTSVTVGPQGDVRFCACDEQNLGNIRTEPLGEIVAHTPLKVDLFERDPECQKCDLVEICRSGCRASGRAIGQLSDPLQPFFKAVKLRGELLSAPRYLLGQQTVSTATRSPVPNA